jgi:mxaJ protein
VIAGDVDVAVAWGPLAGYFAKLSDVELRLQPVSPQVDVPFLPQVYDISLGVRRDDKALKAELDSVLYRNREGIAAILTEYGVPRIARPGDVARN